MRTSISVGLLAGAVAAGGCGGKGEKADRASGGTATTATGGGSAATATATAAPAGSGAPSGKPPPPTLALEPLTLRSHDGLVITAKVPAGWTVENLGEGRMYLDREGAMDPSMVLLAPDCSGDCATVGARLKTLPDEVIGDRKDSGFAEVEVLRRVELPGGGFDLALRLAPRPDDPASGRYEYMRALYGEGWPKAVKCTTTVTGHRVHVRDTLAEVCASVTVTRQ